MATKVLPFYQRKHKHFGRDYRSAQSKYVVQEYSASSERSREVSEKRVSACSMKTATAHTLRAVCVEEVDKKMSSTEKYIREESMIRGPEFLVRLRSHTVWENNPVKLFCTVHGYPTPALRWYKDDVIIDTVGQVGKYKVQSNYGVHSLEILRCSPDDTAMYTAVATNAHGQASSQASVIVKRCRGEEESCLYAWLPYDLFPTVSMLPEIKYTKIEITFLETFDVKFKAEGESVTLTCKMIINPNLANLQPEALWLRDDHLLKESKWAKMESGGGIARLTLPELYKDDEGLYTLRMVTKGGTAQHSAYVFVQDGPPPVPKAPGAPMDIKIHDANRDYVIVSWKPPNTTTEGPIIGYFVDRCEVGTENWVQCNDSPIKICKYPVSGLFEGHSYYFRVRAVNSHGISKPSKISEPIAALDPTEFERLKAMKLGGNLDVVTFHDDLEGSVSPGAPSHVHSSETDRTYVVLSWQPPDYRGRAPMWYYIEKCLVDSGSWQRVNTQVPVRSPRYAVFDLAEGKEYQFRVLSANIYGTSEPSKPTGPIKTQELRGVPSAPGQVVSTRDTKTSVLVQWAPPKVPNNLIGYYIDSCVKGTNDWVSCNHKPNKDTRFVVHGLKTGETYVFRVQAINEIGLSDESQESSPLSVQAALEKPSAPYNIALLHCDGTSMILSWKPPKRSGGAEVTDYYIDKREVSHHHWREVNIKPTKERLFKVENLKSGALYEFRVHGASLAGVGAPSEISKPFLCDAWNMPEPGPAYDLSSCEVRNDSVVIEWKPPVYTGHSPVTGYFVEKCKKGSDQWSAVNETAVSHCYLKVCQLEEGQSYVFRVRAQNAHGVGKPSTSSDSACIKALPGTKEIVCGVDKETGDLYMLFESCEMSEKSEFIWKKSYQEITDFSKGIVVKTEGNHSKLIFKNPDMEDIGTFSISVSHTDGVSASYHIAKEEMEKILAQSYEIRNPIIPLKSELAYKIVERGRVRFWVQAESISSAVTYKFFANSKEVVNSEMSHDVSTGIIEMVLDHFTMESEGTYAVQIQDGKAKNQSSLVLIGDGESPSVDGSLCSPPLGGLGGGGGRVANLKKESVFHWYKDDEEIIPDVKPDLTSGVCKLPLPLVMFVFLILKQDLRFTQIPAVPHLWKAIPSLLGSSAAELVIQCTAEGIRLQCSMKYYTEEMRIHWFHKYVDAGNKLSASERLRVGGTPEKACMEIVEPTEKDKGQYTIEIMDAEKTYSRSIELSGQVFNGLMFESSDRGKVVGGLPDVVTIMEKKTLSLTCTVCGDPKPQVTWYSNDKEVEPDDHFVVALDSGRFASLTIKGVSLEDSGKYTMDVHNKYGGEAVDITVSVYKHGDKVPDVKPTMSPKRVVLNKVSIPIPAPAPAPTPAPAPKTPAAAAKPAGRGPPPLRRK
uniref:Myomesin 2 n=1 Tax=Scleropages formosus TaxID=113540 RepID=A0A8C9RRS4_SCLFO